MNTNSFQRRHIGPNNAEQAKMLATINAKNLEQLIDETVPDNILLRSPLDLEPAMSEYEYLGHIKELSEKNKVFKSYIGLGYNEAIVPSVIQRNILENPGWYTAYTPYQAEIAQGRLEALLNYQTMICDLTGMELANASLLDEATAAAEAMTLLYDVRERAKKKAGAHKFFVSKEILPQTLSLLQTRSTPIGIELVIGNHEDFDFSDDFFGAILQYPGKLGQVFDYENFVAKANGPLAGAFYPIQWRTHGIGLLAVPGVQPRSTRCRRPNRLVQQRPQPSHPDFFRASGRPDLWISDDRHDHHFL